MRVTVLAAYLTITVEKIPMDVRIAKLLQEWRTVSKYSGSQEYIFATESNRAGDQRGKQPVSLAKVMHYHIQHVARAVGITKKIGWHTLRHTFATSLHHNGEGIKIVQELLRHSSSRITMDIYAQAVTEDKRRAQSKTVPSVRIRLAPPRSLVCRETRLC